MFKHIKLSVVISFCVLVIAPASSVNAFDELQKEWKLVKNKNGIQVYVKHTDDSKLKTFKGVTVFQVDEPLKFVSVVNDYEQLAKLMHLISAIEEKERKTDIVRDLRVKTYLPWPVKNRDVVIKASIEQDPETLNVIIGIKDIKSDKYPKEKSYIRMPHTDALLKIELLKDKNIRFTYRAVLDTGGYIPAVLVNLMMKDAPYYSLKKIRRVLQGDQYAGSREAYIEYPKEW